MRVDPPETGTMSRRGDDPGHAARCERPMGCLDAHEHRPIHRRHWPAPAQIPDDRVADIVR
jgi:hypothetical protein